MHILSHSNSRNQELLRSLIVKASIKLRGRARRMTGWPWPRVQTPCLAIRASPEPVLSSSSQHRSLWTFPWTSPSADSRWTTWTRLSRQSVGSQRIHRGSSKCFWWTERSTSGPTIRSVFLLCRGRKDTSEGSRRLWGQRMHPRHRDGSPTRQAWGVTSLGSKLPKLASNRGFQINRIRT